MTAYCKSRTQLLPLCSQFFEASRIVKKIQASSLKKNVNPGTFDNLSLDTHNKELSLKSGFRLAVDIILLISCKGSLTQEHS